MDFSQNFSRKGLPPGTLHKNNGKLLHQIFFREKKSSNNQAKKLVPNSFGLKKSVQLFDRERDSRGPISLKIVVLVVLPTLQSINLNIVSNRFNHFKMIQLIQMQLNEIDSKID